MSLSGRVLLIAIGLLAAGLAIGSTVMIDSLQRHLVSKIDEQLKTTADGPVSVYKTPDPSSPGESVLSVRNAFTLPGSTSYLARLAKNGEIVNEERIGGQTKLPGPELDGIATTDRPIGVPSRSGQGRWRLIAQPLSDGGLRVNATSLVEVDDTVGQLRTVSLATGVTLLAVLTLAGWFAVRAGLRPLRRIEETSAAIAGGELSRRVPETGGPNTEIGQLSTALNTMLGQNEAAFAARAESEARMRRFVGDASHELRTPLAGIKGFSKLHRMGALPAGVDAVSRIEKESDRLERLVDDLLLLAQLDEQVALQRAPMDLRTLAADALHDVQALDPSRTAALTGPGGGPSAAAPALADEARLRQVVTNLVGNAVQHTPEGTPIRVGVGSVDGYAVLEVVDEGPGLTPEQAERVFHRFYRADDSRSRTGGGGAGLGLAIVHSLVQAHHGHIELRTSPGQGTTFRVVLPSFADSVADSAANSAVDNAAE